MSAGQAEEGGRWAGRRAPACLPFLPWPATCSSLSSSLISPHLSHYSAWAGRVSGRQAEQAGPHLISSTSPLLPLPLEETGRRQAGSVCLLRHLTPSLTASSLPQAPPPLGGWQHLPPHLPCLLGDGLGAVKACHTSSSPHAASSPPLMRHPLAFLPAVDATSSR